MRKTFKFITISSTFALFLHIQVQAALCTALLSPPEQAQNSKELSGATMVESLRHALDNSSISGTEVTKDEVKAFSSKEGSLNLLPSVHTNQASLRFSLWFMIESAIFNSPQMETPKRVKDIEALYDRYLDVQPIEFTSLNRLIKASKKAKGAFKAKTALARVLKANSTFLSLAYGQEINLLNEKGFLSFFGVESKTELITRRRTLIEQNGALNQRIHQLLTPGERTGYIIFEELRKGFFKESKPLVPPSDYNLYDHGPSQKEVSNLISSLGLPKDTEARFIDDLNKMADDIFFPGKKNWQAHIGFTLLLFKAYEVQFGELNHLKAENGSRVLTSKAFFLVKQKIISQTYARAIVEAQLETYVNKTDELNARIEVAVSAIRRRGVRYPEHRAEYQDIEDHLQELAVTDLGSNLERREQALSQLEVDLDALTEQALKEVRNENIEDFTDLNNRWQRLIPGKKYKLDGTDYNEVSFTQDVIDAFKDQPLLGTRYLAALSKSYVPMKGASGLRMITSIHKAFRDIKVVRDHGKIRVVGKLIGSTIHFFYVYKSEKPYDTSAMAKKIEQFPRQ